MDFVQPPPPALGPDSALLLQPHWSQLLDSAGLLTALIDAEGRLFHASTALQRCAGWPVRDGQATQRPPSGVFPLTEPCREQVMGWLSGSLPLAAVESEIIDPAGVRHQIRWHPTRVQDATGRTVGLALLGTDISVQRINEARMRRLSDFYRALADMGQAAVHIDDPLMLYRAICRIAVESGRAKMAWIGMVGANRVVPVAWGGSAREYTQGMELLCGTPGSSTVGMGPTGVAATSGCRYVCNDFLADPRSLPWRDHALAFGVRASAAFPIHRAGKTIGTLNLYFSEAGAFDDDMIELVEQLVANLCFALDHIDREAARAKAVHEAQEGYERFRRVFSTLPVPAAIFRRPDGYCVEANEASARLYGLPRDALVGHSTAELDIGLGAQGREALFAAIDRDGGVHDHEARVRTRGGEMRDVLMNVTPIEFLGQPSYLNINVDVTDWKRMGQSLRERELQLAAIVETAMDAIITLDAQHRIVLFNQAAAQMFGVDAREAIGGSIDRFIVPEMREAHRQHLARFAMERGRARHMGRPRQFSGHRANGEVFPMEASISRVGDGDRTLMTVIARDVTRLREAERAEVARAAAEAANRAKTEFLSRISHELRTPLNAVLGFAQLMNADTADPLSAHHHEQIELVLQAGSHLRALIDEMLDVSGIEAGRVAIEQRDFELCELIDGVLRMSQPHAAQCQVTLQGVAAELTPMLMRADPARLRQVLLNLVSNAIKYNRPGGWVRIELERDPYFVHIIVRDNGLGLNEAQRAGLFVPFNRLGREHSQIPGTGIGLVLVRQLVGLMSGELTIDSQAGTGTAVRVKLPASDARPLAADRMPHASPGQDEPPQPSGVVLYIEDNPINAILVERLLARWPEVHLVVAADGRAGLERARTLSPKVVLLDMQLPDMNGLGVLQRLRADESTRHIPVIALSATAAAEDVADMRAAGAVDYWTKPIDFKRFVDGMRALLCVPPAA